jgi:hypothetical protein
MLLKIKHRPDVDNPRNYPAEIIEELEELLLSGGSALPDPRRKHFYDLENLGRTFFIDTTTGAKSVLLVLLIRSSREKARTSHSGVGCFCLTQPSAAPIG